MTAGGARTFKVPEELELMLSNRVRQCPSVSVSMASP